MAGNRLSEILAAWRQAERTAQEHLPGTEEREVATAAADRLRTEYRAVAAHDHAFQNEQAGDFGFFTGQAEGRGRQEPAR